MPRMRQSQASIWFRHTPRGTPVLLDSSREPDTPAADFAEDPKPYNPRPLPAALHRPRLDADASGVSDTREGKTPTSHVDLQLDGLSKNSNGAILNIVLSHLRAIVQLVEGELSKERFDEAPTLSPRDHDEIAVADKNMITSSARASDKTSLRNSCRIALPAIDKMASNGIPCESGLAVDFPKEVNAKKRPPSTRTSFVIGRQSSAGESVSDVPSEEFKWLMAQFRRLDVCGRGELSPDDCCSVMARHDRDIEVQAMAKMLSHLKAATSGAPGNLDDSMDFDAFVFLMTNTDWRAHPDVSKDLESLKLALTAEALAEPCLDLGYRPSRRSIRSRVSSRNSELRLDTASLPAEAERSLVTMGLDTIPAFMIMCNAVAIGLEADYGSDTPWFWEMCELIFAIFFTAEFVVQIAVVGCTKYWLTGADRLWNYFDAFCVVTAVLDMGITYGGRLFQRDGPNLEGFTFIDMLRLARLARLVRLLRFKIFVELKMMILGVVSGVRVLVWAIVLLFVVIFVLGILMRKLVGNDTEEFSSLSAAMFTLFRCFTDGCSAYNGTPLQERLRFEHGFKWMLGYMMVILFVTIGIFNLIMAIFIDNVSNAHMQRRQAHLGKSADAVELKVVEVIARRIAQMDLSGNRASERLRRSVQLIAACDFKNPTTADFIARRRRANDFFANRGRSWGALRAMARSGRRHASRQGRVAAFVILSAVAFSACTARQHLAAFVTSMSAVAPASCNSEWSAPRPSRSSQAADPVPRSKFLRTGAVLLPVAADAFASQPATAVPSKKALELAQAQVLRAQAKIAMIVDGWKDYVGDADKLRREIVTDGDTPFAGLEKASKVLEDIAIDADALVDASAQFVASLKSADAEVASGASPENFEKAYKKLRAADENMKVMVLMLPPGGGNLI